MDKTGYMYFILIVICIIAIVIVAVLEDHANKTVTCFCKDVKSDNPEIIIEQQMRFDEIAKFYAERGTYKALEKCLEEEGQWWKEVSWSCPPKKLFGPDRITTMTCEELDGTRPFRIKHCKNNGECTYQYFNMK